MAVIHHIHNDHIGVHNSSYTCEWTTCRRRGQPQGSRFALISHIRSHTGLEPARQSERYFGNMLAKSRRSSPESQNSPSPFAASAPENSITIPCGEGAAFPKTIKSDKNIEVLTAWKSVTSDPKFKDVDISYLCSEFTSKVRCDGSQVVLEPQVFHSILETLSNKQ